MFLAVTRMLRGVSGIEVRISQGRQLFYVADFYSFHHGSLFVTFFSTEAIVIIITECPGRLKCFETGVLSCNLCWHESHSKVNMEIHTWSCTGISETLGGSASVHMGSQLSSRFMTVLICILHRTNRTVTVQNSKRTQL